MRERTPSADDTPKRAPPAPTREAASADIAGSGETSNDEPAVGCYRAAKLSDSSTPSTTSSHRMVASTQSLDDLDVNHPANASSGDHQQQQQQQERYGHVCKSAQTAQDKRSRLSNVINNLRKKVPDGTASSETASESPKKEEDSRNSVERNLETLEKYVMTVLNGVIKDDDEEEDKNTVVGDKSGKNIDKMKEPDRSRRKGTDEEPTGMAIKSDYSNKDDTADVPQSCFSMIGENAMENIESSEIQCSTDYIEAKVIATENVEKSEAKIDQESKEPSQKSEEEPLDVDENIFSTLDSYIGNRDTRERKENQSLGTIIMNRLSEHQVEERANVDDGRGSQHDEHMSENTEMRAICMELLEDLLNDVYRAINRGNEPENERLAEAIIEDKKEKTESRVGETKDTNLVQKLPIKGLHCSLPLDKVASVLQKCQASELISRTSTGISNPSSITQNSTQKSSPKSSSCVTSIRLLCLYCDRKFLSISLRQRHTERVHQLGGGRRSERNLRKPSQNCQYCSEKCVDTLEGLFQHMVGSHGDKYHACVQCSTRYPNREALMGHMSEMHNGNAEKANQMQPEKIKEGSPCKEFCSQNLREKANASSVRERKSDENALENQSDSRTENDRTKIIAARESVDNPTSPEFDNSFYSNVSCNIRENLLNHLDGKLQVMSGSTSTCVPVVAASTTTTTIAESKSQQHQQLQQSYYEHNVNQVQFPIDISLTAATPVYSKDYASEEYENSSEYARKAGKTSSSRPRRVSFEKYNFPRKYDGRGQWPCSIKDLSNFDISTQLLLRKKQQLIKERLSISRLHQTPILSPSETTEVSLRDSEQTAKSSIETTMADDQKSFADDCLINMISVLDMIRCDLCEPPPSEIKQETTMTTESSPRNPNKCAMITTDFSIEFASFMRLRRREQSGNETLDTREIAHAELSGEWSRPRIYICGACGSKQVMLKEMEDHKTSTHPHVLCSHFDLAGDQRKHYKHLYLPGRNAPDDETRDAIAPMEMACTKCTKKYQGAAELHRHMLECGGDHAWLLGLNSSGKKKCKWRPFGSRSRRRRHRGMKRNIQNSQSSLRVSTPKEKQPPAGPRIRPSDRESIQKMLANLPPKRATRKILQDNTMRSQRRLRNVRTRTRSRIIGDNSSASRISRNKAALRNKLLKNAKSIQRNRCRSDNISAAIESVVKNCHENEKRSYNDNENTEATNNRDKDAKEINEVSSKINKASDSDDKTIRSKIMGRYKILGKRRNVRTRTGSIVSLRLQGRNVDKLTNFKTKNKSIKFRNPTILLTKTDANDKEVFFPKSTPKNEKITSKPADEDDIGIDSKKALTNANKNKLSQSITRRKRIVDPVASLNASIKAKSQLRTQDGKFARNPNKTSESLVKSLEPKEDEGKHNKTTESNPIKSKSGTTQKSKRAELQQPHRVTRLSSDSDKMPTLEPVVQISNEEYIDKSANDLPILSPATSSVFVQEQKILRTVTKCSLKGKESDIETDTDLETTMEKVGTKEQKRPRGRRPKEKMKDIAKRKEVDTNGENKVSWTSKNSLKVSKEERAKRRKNLSIKSTNTNEDNKEDMSRSDKIGRKDTKMKKEEVMKETRSSSKARQEKESSNLPDIPFEVKKLLGSASKEDLLNTLELASNDGSSKRSLRQSTPRSRVLQASDKCQRGLGYELGSSKDVTKREKNKKIRKSMRKNNEKKSDRAKTILDNDALTSAINDIQLERSHQSRRDSRASAKALLNDSKNVSSSEVGGNSSRKESNLLGKSRSRNKSVDETTDETSTCAIEEHNCSESIASNEKEHEKEIEEIVGKTDKSEIEDEGDSNSSDLLDSAVVNLNLSHLQLETSNSVDSGKENSLEAPVNTHKLKVTRPRKIWGARRERASRKRSLSNVIGILTEGINIPVEAQQSVVLTVQTSLDNDPDRLSRNGVVQQPTGENNVVAVDSFSELALTKNNESSENEVVTANATTSHHQVDDIEKDIHSSPGKVQNDENSFTQEVDIPKTANTEAYSPTNDIILDLSRRKPKGKGSFLEKIVSKIVKQKDALLEGEMGTLLDTAADELTSILDEVGPTFTDNMENTNSDEINQALKNDESKISVDTSIEKELVTDSEIQSSKDDETVNVVSKCSIDSLEIQDDLEENVIEKNETQVQNDNQIKMDSVLDVTKDDDAVDKQVNDTICSIEQLQIELCMNRTTINEETNVPIDISSKIPSSMTNNSTETSNLLDAMQKTSPEKVIKENCRKSERKFNKRSLDYSNSPKKNKRRSLEIKEKSVEENATQKELQLDDIIAFIHKPEEISSVENRVSEKHDEIYKTSNTEIKISQNNESKIMNNDLNASLEKNPTENSDRSSLEKSIDPPEIIYNDANKYLKESTKKIISETIVIDVRSKESLKEDGNSLKPSSDRSKKSADKIQKKNENNTNKSTSRRTMKRKSQPALEVAIPSLDAATDVFQISAKSVDESKDISSSSHRERSFGLTDEQSIKARINEVSNAPIEKCVSPTQMMLEKHEEIQNTNSSNNSVNLVSPKMTRKDRKKKKSLADEHLDLPDDESADITTDSNKKSDIEDSNEQLHSSLEHFKVPEITDILQNTKKRGQKRKSLSDIGRWNGGAASENACMNDEPKEIEKSPNSTEEAEEQREAEKCTVEENSSTKRLERSNSSDSIRLIASAKTRSSRKKQLLSTEDLDPRFRSRSTESTDDLSESSCASEFSYFRKKRFAKKKKKEEVGVNDETRADSPITDIKPSKNGKRNAKRNTSTKSLLNEHLDLPDTNDIDIPADIQASLENAEILEDIERKFEHTEKSLQDECTNETMVSNDPAQTDNDPSSAAEQAMSNNYDPSDDLITPKKRTAGNFVVAHTKTGEILIVEKKKKLTKEAPRFFCDLCETSFTRKSSLKKHTLSQSHMSQVSKSVKIDKTEFGGSNSASENSEEINDSKNDQSNNQLTKDTSENMQLQRITENSLELNESCTSYADSIESLNSLMDPPMTKQQLEDELLDEEICKITKNMSHDEYVLTDHVTPEQSEASSTPIKQPVQQREENSKRRKHGEKKRNKKRNLAEEHLILDSPELNRSRVESDEFLNTVNDVVQLSMSSSERNSTKEIVKTIEKTVDISEETCMDFVKTKDQTESIIESSDEKVEYSKSSDIDTKIKKHTESIRTTRGTVKKLSKTFVEGKEENQVMSSPDDDKTSNRFSLRLRRNKKIHYAEYDNDVYFLDTSMEINGDETDDNCDIQKRQNEMEEETNTEILQETEELDNKEHTNVENKIFEDTKVMTPKLELTLDTRRTCKKRGRPKLKNRIVSNSSIGLSNTDSEINVNDAAVDNFEESEINDQKSSSPAREHSTESNKLTQLDVDTQLSKPKRGRPRKNIAQAVSSCSLPIDDSNISMSRKLNRVEINERIEEIAFHSKIVNEETASISFERKNEQLNLEEDSVLLTDLNNFDERLEQKERLADIEISNTILAKDSNIFNVSSEKDNIINTSNDTKCVSDNENNSNDTSVNILMNIGNELPADFPIAKETQNDVQQDPIMTDILGSDLSKTIDSDENSEALKLLDSSESLKEKQMKSEEKFSEDKICELSQEEAKFSSESENSEDEVLVTDNKSHFDQNSQKLQSQQTIDNTIDIQEKMNQLDMSNKETSKDSQSNNKEKESDRKKSKTSRGRNTKIAMIKIASLSSDSENEDEIESVSSSKNKIVKSVFGRVFGGEKIDKVKEVLNDWVSRSEDDSDISRSASEARSCMRGTVKISEKGHKDKKRHSGSDARKDIERSAKKKGNDKGGSAEIHEKLKNRKKRERNSDSASKCHVESLSLPNKRKCKESKIKADEKILKTFDDESLILLDEENKIKKIPESRNQFENNYSGDKDEELKKYNEENWNRRQERDVSSSEDRKNLRIDHNGKSKNHSNCHKKRDLDTRNDSSLPLQLKCKRRESKSKASERIWKAFDNDTSSYLSDGQNPCDASEERNTLYESRGSDRLDNPKNVKRKDNDTRKNVNLEEQKQIEINSARGKSKKGSSNRKKKDSNAAKDSNIQIPRDLDNKALIPTNHQEIKNGSQDLAKRCISESKNHSKNMTIVKDTNHEFSPCNDSVASNYMHQDRNNSPVKLDHQSKASVTSRKGKKEYINDDWTRSTRNLDTFCQKDLTKDNGPNEKDVAQKKSEDLTVSSRSCSSLAYEESTIRDQSVDLNERNVQSIRDSDEDDNDEEDNESNDLGRRRMSPFYAHETLDSSMESSSNDEEEEDEEEEEKHMTRESNSRKTNPSEFSGEKVVIRSPSSGHRTTDVVTIAPTDAIEDNALDVPREHKSTTEPRQGKILNFDEELFVECCSRLKATSENELRGAKKIKLDHTEFYHRRDDQPQGFRVNRDRWRDVESQNSLGSLLESVNQLLGEEMYSGNEKNYRTRDSERSSRSASPDALRADNLGYEDSLDVAFEHNNKLRDKIQQRMRESENLIASTFGQRTDDDDQDHSDDDKRDNIGDSCSSIHEGAHLSIMGTNKEQELSPKHKNKMNPTLGGLLDKALSNLLHNNSKHDHNGSAPMKLLAELACARAPTSTSLEDDMMSGKNHQSVKMMAAVAAAAAAAAAAAVATKDSTSDSSSRKSANDTITISKSSSTKKMRNPIKELFERKKEINDRKEQERLKAAALVELNNMQRQRKTKKNKKKQHQEFPLIRRNEHYGGLVEKKKRRDFFERKAELLSERIKDVYEFDEEESQIAPTLGSVMSYRNQTDKNYEISSWSKTKNANNSFDTSLEKDKMTYIADIKLSPAIEHKFCELEKFAPKTKGALKSFQSEEQQQQQQVVNSISGPMDEFVERRQRSKRSDVEYSSKQARFKKRGKSSKKRTKNAWYENDSSDEFRTAAKAEDAGVGVGISKSQRACSKGKQNLFAELSTSSESEYEQINHETVNDQCSPKSKNNVRKSLDVDGSNADHNEQIINDSRLKNEDQISWRDQMTIEENIIKKDRDITKSESELSDHSLVIDERKTTDEARNSDDDADNRYETAFELDDLYREDSSDTETEIEENEAVIFTEEVKNTIETETLDKNTTKVRTEITSTNMKEDYTPENELIPLEEALDLLDQHEDFESKSENLHAEITQMENAKIINSMLETMDATSNDEILNEEETENKSLSLTETRDKKEEMDDDIPTLPEKLSSNEKPQKESDNLPLHVFLSRKVQESKKRKQQQLDKLREEQERILMDLQPTRRQRKCAIGKQGLLAEISSSDEESYARYNSKKSNERSEHDKMRKKKESKEKKKERYIEKKHEQMIAKEQKAIEEEILREVKRKEILAQSADDTSSNIDNMTETKIISEQNQKRKHQTKEKQKKIDDEEEESGENAEHTSQSFLDSSENIYNKLEYTTCITENIENDLSSLWKHRKSSKSPAKSKRCPKTKKPTNPMNKQRSKQSTVDKSKSRTTSSSNKDSKERKSANGKHDSDDEELKTGKSWNKVEEGVGVAIGRRKRTAALQLYYWSSSSDEEEPESDPIAMPEEEEEDDRQEQHGWIVGDSHKRMITMLAMEKQLKEKRRRSEDEFESGKTKSRKHRNSTS